MEEPDIGLHVFSYTREDLIHEINKQLAMLWEEYAVTTDELAADARTLQAKLHRERLRRTLHAPRRMNGCPVCKVA